MMEVTMLQKRRPSLLFSYIRVTRTKLLIWGILLLPAVMIEFSLLESTPLIVRSWLLLLFSQVSTQTAMLFGSQSPQMSSTASIDELFLAYFGLSYLWACIFAQTFAILSSHKKQSTTRRVRK